MATLRALGWLALGLTSVASAKGQSPEVSEERLARTMTLDGIELPAGTFATREAAWDEARDRYGPSMLSQFQLARPATVCATALPAGIPISVRRGLPGFADLGNRSITSTAMHLEWTAPRSTRIGDREVRAGEAVGVECPSGKVLLLAGAAPFEVDRLRVDAALWYPRDLGGGLLAVWLVAPAEIVGVRVPAGFIATFAPDGALVTLFGPPTSGVGVGDRVCWTWMPGNSIRFDRQQLAKCTDAITAGARCDPHHDIRLYDYGSAAGHLASCTLAAPFSANGHTWKAGTTLRLDTHGTPVAR